MVMYNDKSSRCNRRATEWNKLERERDWYRSRMQLLEKYKGMFREPELTLVCDILANGRLLPDPDGKRYVQRNDHRDLAHKTP